MSLAYDKGFLDALKQLIPSGDRQFDPNTKFWYFKEMYGDFIRDLATKSFGQGSVSFTSKTVAGQARAYSSSPGASGKAAMPNSSSGTTEDAIVAFFSLIPYDAAKRSYLLASQTLHPDKPTGDAQKMSKLNELWARLEKEFFKR